MARLLDTEFIEKLENLKFMIQRLKTREGEGGYSSTSKGGTVEFSSHRKYAAGEDIRYIDWNIFARLDQLFIKEFDKEEQLVVDVLVDMSQSMSFGRPPKRDQAIKIAAAMCYIALAGGNRVRVHFLRDGTVTGSSHFYGEGKVFDCFNYLEGAECGGTTSIAESVKRAVTDMRRSLLILVSDLFDPDEKNAKTVLGIYRAKGKSVSVFHVMSPEEIRPPALGRVEAVDTETGEAVPIILDEARRAIYGEEVSAYVAEWERLTSAHNIIYLNVDSSESVFDVVMRYLKKGGAA